MLLPVVQSTGAQIICSVLCISGLQVRRCLGQLTMLAQKTIGFLIRHSHDRESIRVFLLDRAQQIIAGLQTRHQVREISAGWNSASGPCSPDWILARGVNFFWSAEGAARHAYDRGDAKAEAWMTFRFTIQVW